MRPKISIHGRGKQPSVETFGGDYHRLESTFEPPRPRPTKRVAGGKKLPGRKSKPSGS